MKLEAAKKFVVAGAVLLSQSICISALPVLAADSSVRIAGQPVFSIPVGGGGLTADKRAETIQNNLDNALVAAKDRSPSAVNIVYAKGLPVITVGGYQVMTIDGATAKAANTTPALLAKQWADSIRNSLGDQNSINSYVAQLSGGYTASAPPAVQTSNSMAINSTTPQAQQIAQADPQLVPPPPLTTPYNAAQTPSTQYQGSAAYSGAPPNGMPPGGYAGGAGYPGGYPGGGYPGGYPGGPGMRQGHITYAPAGLVMPISLQTGISTQVAKAGDLIEANITQNMVLGDSSIPAGSVVVGTITDAEAGRRLSRSGLLTIKFNRLRTPDGVETPISAHLVGGIAKYQQKGGDQSGTVRGEGGTAKLGQGLIRTGVGAGLGAGLGTAIGAIAGRGYGGAIGRGAWSGTAIGGGLGAADMLLRKGRDVNIPAGTSMQLQLDAPASIAGAGGPPYTGNL